MKTFHELLDASSTQQPFFGAREIKSKFLFFVEKIVENIKM
jgi:hypothetical protein